MSDIFIAHVEEDADVALEIALGLEEAGYKTWVYEVDSIPGPSYLIQTGKAVAASKAVVVIISPHSVGSRQVTKEIVRAHESGSDFIPILRGITHVEFQNRQPEWREAVGAAASTSIPREGVAPILPRIISGLGILGISPGPKRDAAKIIQIRRLLDELRRHDVTKTTVEQPPPAKKPETEPVTAGIPPTRAMEKAGRRKKWVKRVLVVTGIAAAVVIVMGIIFSLPASTPPSTPTPPAPPAEPAPAVTQEPTNLFYDDFESGKLTSWQVASNGGGAQVNLKEGKYFLDCNSDVNCLAGSPSWTDYTIKVKVLLLEGQAIIRFRQFPVAADQGKIAKSYVLILTQDMCSLQKAYYDRSIPPQVLASAPAQIKPDTWQEVFIICQGNKVAFGLNHSTILDYVDNQEPILSGAIALGSQGALSHAVFDDIFVGGTVDTQTTSVTFPDEILDKAIRTALGKQPSDSITEAELAKLTKLDASQKGISDLTGISYLVNLTELVLFSNQISDIQPLSTLTNLEMLTLDGNQISDIRPLSSLTKLTSLYLHGNQITDIQSLATNSGLSAGDIVTLQGNPLSPISVNDYVPQLEKRDVIVLVYSTPQQVYQDDFSNPASGWPAVSNDQYEVFYKNGEYYFIEKKGGLSYVGNQNAGTFADLILEADVRLVSGPNQNAFGIIFRQQDTENFYFFKVTANGYYVVGKRLKGIPQVILNEESKYLQKGYTTNRLKVVSKGSKIAVYVNGNYLTTIIDDSFVKGYIGVSIGSGTSELATTVAFDNISLYDIPTHSP